MNAQLVKKFTTLVIIIVIMGCGMSCSTTIMRNGKNPPPGQMKKATGSKSAKPFAPGQQNKKN